MLGFFIIISLVRILVETQMFSLDKMKCYLVFGAAELSLGYINEKSAWHNLS